MQADSPSLVVQVVRTLETYVRGQVRITLTLACLYAIGFAVAGLPEWLLVGALCGAANLVPVFGPLIGLGLAMLAALFADGEAALYLAVLAVFVVVQAVEGFYLTPHVLGRSLRLPPFAVFVAVLGASALFGPLGVLLAVPVLAVVAVVWRHVGAPR